MNATRKTKLTSMDKKRINARFMAKMDEYSKATTDELKAIADNKMSSTDRYAYEYCVQKRMKESISKQMESNGAGKDEKQIISGEGDE